MQETLLALFLNQVSDIQKFEIDSLLHTVGGGGGISSGGVPESQKNNKCPLLIRDWNTGVLLFFFLPFTLLCFTQLFRPFQIATIRHFEFVYLFVLKFPGTLNPSN